MDKNTVNIKLVDVQIEESDKSNDSILQKYYDNKNSSFLTTADSCNIDYEADFENSDLNEIEGKNLQIDDKQSLDENLIQAEKEKNQEDEDLNAENENYIPSFPPHSFSPPLIVNIGTDSAEEDISDLTGVNQLDTIQEEFHKVPGLESDDYM